MVKVCAPPLATLAAPCAPLMPAAVMATVKVSADSFRLSAPMPTVMLPVATPPAAVMVMLPPLVSVRSAPTPLGVASTSVVAEVLPRV